MMQFYQSLGTFLYWGPGGGLPYKNDAGARRTF